MTKKCPGPGTRGGTQARAAHMHPAGIMRLCCPQSFPRNKLVHTVAYGCLSKFSERTWQRRGSAPGACRTAPRSEPAKPATRCAPKRRDCAAHKRAPNKVLGARALGRQAACAAVQHTQELGSKLEQLSNQPPTRPAMLPAQVPQSLAHPSTKFQHHAQWGQGAGHQAKEGSTAAGEPGPPRVHALALLTQPNHQDMPKNMRRMPYCALVRSGVPA